MDHPRTHTHTYFNPNKKKHPMKKTDQRKREREIKQKIVKKSKAIYNHDDGSFIEHHDIIPPFIQSMSMIIALCMRTTCE